MLEERKRRDLCRPEAEATGTSDARQAAGQRRVSPGGAGVAAIRTRASEATR